ncbi:hypothetical protein [Fredinandcohnia onubensis]|uniref:hypothetical protein n=1 Tax=Fredinandcohnia onubensis TaxID=1571209 RepID=UPI000C0BDDC8|nr:hypothetical protein [Fredinandcohnia onubensis]
MKKIFFVLTLATLLFTPIYGISGASAATKTISPVEKPISKDLDKLVVEELQYDINKNLSQEEISARFQEINSSYDIGVPFSPEDTEFVKYYADLKLSDTQKSNDSIIQPAQVYNPGGTITASFGESKYQYGVGISISGSVRTTMGNLNHTYGGTFTSYIQVGRTNASKVQNFVTHSAYGFVGTSGTYIGLVHSSSISSTSGKNPSTWSIDEDKGYAAIGVVYTYTNAYARVTTPSGTFTLYGF